MNCSKCGKRELISLMSWYQQKSNGKLIEAYWRVCYNCNRALKQAENYDEMKA